jgi:hypothetical protein
MGLGVSVGQSGGHQKHFVYKPEFKATTALKPSNMRRNTTNRDTYKYVSEYQNSGTLPIKMSKS